LKKTIQSVQSVEVAFNPSSPDHLNRLRALPLVSDVRKEGDKFRLITEDPGTVIEGVTAYAREHQVRIISMTTIGPSLEDVFIKLTGLVPRVKGVKVID
jgi:ABC-2 type transport system ATP-binding protein